MTEYSYLDREQHGKLEDSVDIKPGCTWDSGHQIFQGDSLSLLPILRDARTGYQLKNEGCKIKHLLLMDDLRLYEKNSNQVHSLPQTVWRYSEDSGMKFGIDKCAVLELERGRLVRCEG